MARRKGWDQLKPNYRKRLERGGITERSYNSGVSLARARGEYRATVVARRERKRLAPSNMVPWRLLARGLFVKRFIPDWDTLTHQEQDILGEMWVLGFMTTGPSDEYRKSLRQDFISYINQTRGDDWDREDWKQYRDLYATTFTR